MAAQVPGEVFTIEVKTVYHVGKDSRSIVFPGANRVTGKKVIN